MKDTVLRKKGAFIFFFGAFVYGALEIIWRGYTHPTMLILGGTVLCVVFRLEKTFKHRSRLFRAALYSLIITCAEFVFGAIFNLWLGLGVWNYSDKPFNILGQICPAYYLLWFALSWVCCGLCSVFEYIFSPYEKSGEKRNDESQI